MTSNRIEDVNAATENSYNGTRYHRDGREQGEL